MLARLKTWLIQPLESKADEMPDVDWTEMGRVIGGRITSLDDDSVDSAAKRAWRDGGRIPPAPPSPRWQMLLSAFLYTAFVAALAIALLLLAHVTALAIIAVGVGLLRRTSIMT
jgi:hypothetical protein